MRFATVEYRNERILVLEDEQSGQLLHITKAANALYNREHTISSEMLDVIVGGEDVLAIIVKVKEWAKQQSEATNFYINKEEVTWLAPIPRPSKNIFCIGKNYADHAIEMGGKDDIPENVMLFSKAPTAVIGHEGTIPHHEDVTKELDYEGELAVVIGKKGKAIQQSEANDYIFGYTIINDVTARDLQSRHKQFLLGKSLDGTCPMGPVLVHKSAIECPQQLQIETRVNGEVRQDGNTQQFIFSIPEIIEVLSRGMTLEPGDIIATGTPAGVGKGFKPPKFLKSGDSVEITIENIGTLANKIG